MTSRPGRRSRQKIFSGAYAEFACDIPRALVQEHFGRPVIAISGHAVRVAGGTRGRATVIERSAQVAQTVCISVRISIVWMQDP
jgi:hypothetical protein